MKKILALLLSAVICASFTACTDDSGNTQNTSVPETTVAVVETTKGTETVSDTQKDYSPLLYKFADEDSTVYLFGSIHVGTEDMYPLPKYVEDAFSESDVLAVECDITEFEQDIAKQTELLVNFIYTDGTTIVDHIDAETYEGAKQILTENNYYNAMLDYYYPSLWENFISGFLYPKLGYNADLGIDTNLMKRAKESGKTIDEVESVEFQFNMMADFSPELQQIMLADIVEAYNSDESKAELDKLVNDWYTGNEDGIVEDNAEDLSDLQEEEKKLYDEYYDTMITKRNISMADFAEESLNGDKDVFICVGCAHVVGDGGMVDLLSERGYTVTKVG